MGEELINNRILNWGGGINKINNINFFLLFSTNRIRSRAAFAFFLMNKPSRPRPPPSRTNQSASSSSVTSCPRYAVGGGETDAYWLRENARAGRKGKERGDWLGGAEGAGLYWRS